MDKDLFFLIANRLTEANIKVNEEIGGHSAVWAKRGQIEHCKTFIASYPSDFDIQNIPNKSRVQRDFLIYPSDQLRKSIYDPNDEMQQDIHLVFEYLEGDEILGYVAPRSNRFYFVIDPNGGTIT